MLYRLGYPKVLEPVLRFGNSSQIPVTSPGSTFEQQPPRSARQPRRVANLPHRVRGKFALSCRHPRRTSRAAGLTRWRKSLCQVFYLRGRMCVSRSRGTRKLLSFSINNLDNGEVVGEYGLWGANLVRSELAGQGTGHSALVQLTEFRSAFDINRGRLCSQGLRTDEPLRSP
jgi:hypothetical protein